MKFLISISIFLFAALAGADEYPVIGVGQGYHKHDKWESCRIAWEVATHDARLKCQGALPGGWLVSSWEPCDVRPTSNGGYHTVIAIDFLCVRR